MINKTILYKLEWIVQALIIGKRQTLNQSLQQTNFFTVSSKADAV